jgi:hypothetical protein
VGTRHRQQYKLFGRQRFIIDRTTFSNTAPTQWTTDGTTIYYGDGNVGIGTDAPASQFDVYSNSTGESAIKGYYAGPVSGTSWAPFENYNGISVMLKALFFLNTRRVFMEQGSAVISTAPAFSVIGMR